MAEFFQLSTAERLEALDLAANTSGLLPHLLEKDIWVVWSLRHLFAGQQESGEKVEQGDSYAPVGLGLRRDRAVSQTRS